MTSQKEYNYTYENGILMRATECKITLDGSIITSRYLSHSIRYYYDSEGQLVRKVITPSIGSEQTVYYDTKDGNTVVKFLADGKTIVSHSKTDSFGRKEFEELQIGYASISRHFEYSNGEVPSLNKLHGTMKSMPTTQLVSRIIFSNGRTIEYEYDAEERITKVIDSVDGTTEYTYDALGQLLTETVNSEVVNTMTYDSYGNILTKNGKTYTYDSTWKDLLTSVDGQSITYDAQGNPTSYLGHTLTWEKGRQLKSFDGITYTYNANGIRTSKTVNGVKHTYELEGTKILRETWGNNTLIPLYDNEDSICGICYNNFSYYFRKNQQGDVIAIVNRLGEDVAMYSYDAWGVCTEATTNTELTLGIDIANINPFRYRGYYYDAEIGLYYLQSRYYNPVVGRFVNGDDMQMFTVSSDVRCNLYVYCNNTPTMDADILGNIGWASLLKVLQYIFDFIIQIAKTATRMSNEMADIINSIKKSKRSGKSKDWIKQLKEKKKNLMSAKKNGCRQNQYYCNIIGIVFDRIPLFVIHKKGYRWCFLFG